MTEKVALDTAGETARAAEKAVEGLLRKAWTIMDAASEKQQPTQYLGERAIRSIQGEE